MTTIQLIFLAFIQGITELLPISSSSHVILVEKILGFNPTQPIMTLLLITLHTGTMLATIAFYKKSWSFFFR